MAIWVPIARHPSTALTNPTEQKHFSNRQLIIKCYLARNLGFKVQDSRFKIQKEKYENAFQKKYQILENQRICPQYSHYKRFISHENLRCPTQGLFTKTP